MLRRPQRLPSARRPARGAQSAHEWRAHCDWMVLSRRWARIAVLLSSSTPSLNRQSRRTHIDAAHAILTP